VIARLSLFFLFLSVFLTLQSAVLGEDVPLPPAADQRYLISVPKGGLPDIMARRAFPVPLVSAHRGGPMPGFPENAIETFDRSTAYGPTFVEMDIRRSKDGVLFLLHDRTLDRTTTGTGLAAEKLWVDLQATALKDNDGTLTDFKIPSLDAALNWGRDRVVFMLDMKRGVEALDVLAAVQRADALDYVIFITRSIDEAKALYAAAPSVTLSRTAYDGAQLTSLLQSGIPTRQFVVWTGLSRKSKEFYAKIHRLGMSVSMGTLGFDDRAIDRQILENKTPEIYGQLYRDGVDIISTDRHWAVHQLIRSPALVAITRAAAR